MREGRCIRATRETEIDLSVAIDAAGGSCAVQTGARFFDHMLTSFAVHGRFALGGFARSLDAIEHHLIEDTALALGSAIDEALGDRAGIERFGFAYVPMDETLVRAAIDFSGRPFARIALPIGRERVEDLDTQLVAHFFRSLAQTMRATLHVDLIAGDDGHHIIEAAFKATARACAAAWAPTASTAVLSTKGVLA
jgi:imidazoleglycerol phosphate dehydratase HisB